MKPFKLRRANESDLEFLRRLSAQVFSKYGEYDEIVSAWFLQPGVITEIITEGSDPLGFAMLALARENLLEPMGAHLLAISVSAAHRRKGVGSALLNHMEELARKYGASALHLWTAHDNFQAVSFFQKAGFKIIGSEDRYYPKGHPAFAMSKKLMPC
jgi:ribosomal protein S18 acetylase RimI-like enzyme